MRVSSSVTSISWIPSEAVSGRLRFPFDLNLTHYDEPPPDEIDDLEALRSAERFRFANHLVAWAEFTDDGEVTAWGYDGGGLVGATTVSLAVAELVFPPVAFPDLNPQPEVGDGWVRFVQTTGGRTGAPLPRRVSRPPYLQIAAPTTWTTLALTLHADGRSEFELVGASPFPRHWIYDGDGRLAEKTGVVDFERWLDESFGARTPWRDNERAATTVPVETQLERELSAAIMSGSDPPTIREVDAGSSLVLQGAPGRDLFVLLDGVVSVEVQGETLAEIGPGAILGERAILEDGKRTATVRAVTPVKVAVVGPEDVDLEALRGVAAGHRREDNGL